MASPDRAARDPSPDEALPSDLLVVLAALDDATQVRLLLGDLLTPAELNSVRERWAIVKALAAGGTHRAVRDRVGVSIATVSRGSRQLQHGSGGFALAFETLARLGLPSPVDEGGGRP